MRSLYFLGKLGIFLLLLSGTFTSCIRGSKKLNRRITLWRKDDIPYGTRLAYEGLPHLFPDVGVSVNKKSPVDLASNSGTNKAYIILVDHLDPRPSEVTALLNFVGEGNHIFISTHHVADTLLHALGLKASWGTMQGAEPDSLRLKLYDPDTETFHPFSYPGDSYDSWFTSPGHAVCHRDGQGRTRQTRFRQVHL
ncbi:hypothetical protein ACQ86N_13465 [Puia sp. P3]|uniref:hypothetical protein n=1 Tax=Puia sp. P3 TaxID=3423952 RepID=UPI003D67F099